MLQKIESESTPMVEARRFSPRVLVLVVLFSCSACTGHVRQEVPATLRTASEYVIGPGDGLNVFVYRSPELSAPDLMVRPDGRVSLPLVPEIMAAGKTPAQLADEIQAQLKQYVLQPNVTVMIRTFRGPPSRQIRVIGEVAQPMAIPYREGMTVLDVMIETKGLTRYAAGNRAEIIRHETDAGTRKIRVRLADLLRAGDIDQDVALRPGDTLVVPSGWF